MQLILFPICKQECILSDTYGKKGTKYRELILSDFSRHVPKLAKTDAKGFSIETHHWLQSIDMMSPSW